MSSRLRWLLTVVLALVLGTPTVALAQGATITGKVTSEAGEPIMAAAVTIDALTISVGTNAQGQYSIPIPGARVSGQTVILRVRAIGYMPQTRSFALSAGAQTFDFALRQDINRLSQVVITGVTAGTEQRKLPFTVASVSAADMPVPGTNVLNNIQGKIPGAIVLNAGGRPGTTPAIMLRAPLSLNASAGGREQEPLLIVDGIIQSGSLRDIDPLDIENVEVVKGASASTLYGSRAARGVIQITTKSGKNQTEGIRFNTRVERGVSDIESSYRFARSNFLILSPDRSRFCVARSSTYLPVRESQDCLQTMDIYTEALRVNEQAGDVILTPQNFLGDGGIVLAPPPVNLRGFFQVNRWPTSYDPIQQLVTNGEFTKTTVDMTGKFGRANFFSSLGDERQRGSVMFLDGLHRNNIRLNVDQTMGGNWTASVRAYYARTKRATGGGNFFGMTRQPPFVDLLRRDKFGRLFVRSVITNQGGQNTNPAYNNEMANDVAETDRFQGSAQVRWQPVDWLSGTFDFGYDRDNNQSRGQTNRGYRVTTTQSAATPLGSIGRSDSYGQSYNISLNWTARRELLSDLAARFTLRSTYEQQDGQSSGQSGSNLAVPGVTTSNAAIQNQSIGSSESSQRAVGLIASMNLDFRDRYILEASFRRDGLSVFGSANRWQSYGRASVAWRLSEEGWWPLGGSINDFKARYSVGQAGNRPGNTTQYETFSIGSGGTLNPNTLGNKFLKPEVATETEIGVDAELFRKVGLMITNARTKTVNQVLLVPAPASSGFNNQWKNAGTLEGSTWEGSLNVPIIERRDLSWSARVTSDRMKATITALDIPPTFYGCGGATCKYEVGGIFPQMWGRRMVQTCDQLPAAFVARCGEGKEWQRNDEGFIVWVGPGNTWKEGVTKNLWQAVLPATSAPWGVAESWGMAIVYRDDSASGTAKPVKLQPIGHALPDLRWSLSNTVTWRKLSAYVLLDAVKGKDVYNEERHWSLGDFATTDSDQNGKSVETAKPIGYYWRVGPPDATGVGGLYDVKTSAAVPTEDASYVKVREISIGYKIGRIAGAGDWNLSFIGRNLKTWSSYRGFDPEVGSGGGNNDSAILNASDSFGFPNLRSFTLVLSSTF